MLSWLAAPQNSDSHYDASDYIEQFSDSTIRVITISGIIPETAIEL
jgi:hypothetical protein